MTTAPLVLIYSPFPTPDAARAMATRLIEDRLAACVQLFPAVESFFSWQGAVQHEAECILLAKTLPNAADAAMAAIRSHHPYELPAIIRLPDASVNADYATWAAQLLAV